MPQLQQGLSSSNVNMRFKINKEHTVGLTVNYYYVSKKELE